MITKITNNEGKECFAIVFQENYNYESIVEIQKAIINMIQAASDSDIFSCCNEEVYCLLDLLQNTMPTNDQMMIYQKAIFPKLPANIKL